MAEGDVGSGGVVGEWGNVGMESVVAGLPGDW